MKTKMKINEVKVPSILNLTLILQLELIVCSSYNCLKAQIDTVGDLLQYSPEKLQELKNFGRKSADEVFSTIKSKLDYFK
jgi:DNA-directed RNA polymerase alpha subunit